MSLAMREVFPDFVRRMFGGEPLERQLPIGRLRFDGKGGVEIFDEVAGAWRILRSMERYDLTRLFPGHEMPSNLAWAQPPPEFYRPATEPRWIAENRRRVEAGQ